LFYIDNLNNALLSKGITMKIGIIVHSQTGNTLSVAQKLQDKLTVAGHSAGIEKISPVDPKQTDPKKIKLEKLPDLSPYDAYVFAAPVQAFSLSPVMKLYLSQLPSLNGKNVACFITKGLVFKWTGGNHAISQMKNGIEAKGGKVVETDVIVWSGGDREKRIADTIEKLSKSF
jgi:NAD(P)H dehydrogenase (quinone)